MYSDAIIMFTQRVIIKYLNNLSMGASEAKLKEHFLFVIMANREGRVNEFLSVSLLQLISIVTPPICEHYIA
jgi:hypothetical protein